MSKYLGPLWKKSRALKISLLETGKEFSRGKKRMTSPGIHGDKRRRESTYGIQNKEKRKICLRYGLREKNLYNLFIKAKKEKENTGNTLIKMCESRLDNLVFRSGLVNTRGFARLWVSQGHFLVNGKKVKSPSYQVEIGQNISFRKKEKMTENQFVKSNLEQNAKIPPYLTFDKKNLIINYLRYPSPEEYSKDIDTSLAVEWYNRRI